MTTSVPETAPAKPTTPFLDTKLAAVYVRLSPRTLERMRYAGGGPRYRKHGRYVRYHIADLDAWSAGRARTSTGGAEAAATR